MTDITAKLADALREIAACEIEFCEGIPAAHGPPILSAEQMAAKAADALTAYTASQGTRDEETVERVTDRFDHALNVALVAEALLKGFWFSDEKQVVRAARAALSALPADDGWMPIETAPKDGTRVMLWMEPVQDARFVVSDGPHAVVGNWVVWSETGKREGMRDGWSWYGSAMHRPTHWRHLPPAPAQEPRS